MRGTESSAPGGAVGLAVARPAARADLLATPLVRRLGIVVLAALAAALSGVTILRGISPHDEGLMLQAASRVANGQLPYRDFWWNYGPAQPFLLAALWKIGGPSLLSWRVLRMAIDALTSVLVYLLARRVSPRPLAVLAWLAAAGAMAWPTGPGPNPPALALVLGALLLARRRPALAGALCGLAAAFRPELGAAGALSVALAGGRWRSLGAALLVALVAYLPFLVIAPGGLWHDTVGFLGVQDLQRLPLPGGYGGPVKPDKLLEFYLPLILLAGSALWLVRRRALWLAPLTLAGVLYLVGRPDEFHLVPLSVVLSLALALSVAGERRVIWRVGLLAVLALIAIHGVERRAGQLRHPGTLAAVPSSVAGGVQTDAADAHSLRALLPRIDALVAPGRPILVAPPRFDRVRVGDPLLYVLADRPNPTRYDVMQPGVVTTAAVQREMVRELARARPAVVVRWLDPRALELEPNGSARSSGVHLLDRWIAAHYGRPERFGVYLLLRRRG